RGRVTSHRMLAGADRGRWRRPGRPPRRAAAACKVGRMPHRTDPALRRPDPPSGVLFFVHGANQTSEGHAQNVSRLEDQVRARGWDVTVVAPEWRGPAGLWRGGGGTTRHPRRAPPAAARA